MYTFSSRICIIGLGELEWLSNRDLLPAAEGVGYSQLFSKTVSLFVASQAGWLPAMKSLCPSQAALQQASDIDAAQLGLTQGRVDDAVTGNQHVNRTQHHEEAVAAKVKCRQAAPRCCGEIFLPQTGRDQPALEERLCSPARYPG